MRSNNRNLCIIFAIITLYLFSNKVCSVYSLKCSEVLENAEEKIWSTEEIASMTTDDVNECIQQLGKIQLPEVQAKFIWKSLVKHYGGVELIPEEKLNTLHWVTIAVEPEDYTNMTISSIDAVENFGFFYDLSDDQLKAIAERIREDFGGKDPEDYTSYDLIALRQIVCALYSDEVRRIHPLAYKDAAAVLGRLKKCPNEILHALAHLATHPKAFGTPNTWDESIMDTIGIVANGLAQDMIDLLPKKLLGKDNKERINSDKSRNT